MNRVTQRPRDPFFGLIIVIMIACTTWLALTPWVPPVARATMKRFHLRSDSFILWSAQAPIPAMYNFANRYEVRELPEEMLEMPVFGFRVDEPEKSAEPERRYINHFPARLLTFANGRYEILNPGEDRWLTIESSYRGQRIETKIHAKPIEGGFQWIAEEVE